MAKRLYVVGLGPGDERYLTAQARAALEASDVLCGYTVYVDLVSGLFPDKETFTTPMRGEVERCRWALETADSGAVSGLEGCRWAAVFQEDRLLENLDAVGKLRLILGRECAQAAAMLAELGLEDAGCRPVREYSGGMRRRLALARALLAKSDALALDEPFAGLDGETRQRARDCLLRHAGERPVLLVTHDEEDAAGLDAGIVRLA